MHNRLLNFLASDLRSKSYTYGSYFYHRQDCERVAGALVLLYSCLAEYPEFSTLLNPKRVSKYVRELPQTIDIKKIIEEQETILLVIRNYESLDFRSSNDFKGIEASINWLIRPIFSMFLCKQRIKTYKMLNFYCQFISKLTLEVPELVKEIETKWFVADEIRSTYHYHWVQQNRILEMASKRFASVMSNFVEYFKSSVGHFGNGATYNTSRQSGTAGKINYMLNSQEIDLNAYFLLNHRNLDSSDSGFLLNLMTDRALTPSVSKLQLVPKGIYKKRPITMEPLTLSYMQQGARYALERCINESTIMVDFNDQELSKQLALVGSRESTNPYSYATRDLSSASDDITYQLVIRLCKYCPEVLDVLSLLRTGIVEDSDGNHHPCWCYAGMGNAVTFRLESLIFSICCEVAIRITNKALPWAHLGSQDYRVYGDDIIIPNLAVEKLDWVLDQLNFTVNADKSYDSEVSFREACGIEAYKGYDVTPIRLSRKIQPEYFFTGKVTNSQLTSLLDFLRSIQWTFEKTRHFLTKAILQRNKRLRRLPFVGSSDRFGFPSVNVSEPIYVQERHIYHGSLIGYCCRHDTLYAIYGEKEIIVSKPYTYGLVPKMRESDEAISYFDMITKLSETKRTSLYLPEDALSRLRELDPDSKVKGVPMILQRVRDHSVDEIHAVRIRSPRLIPVS